MEYRHAFEGCKSYNRADATINRNDLISVCRQYGMNYDKVMESITTDTQSRVSLDAFVYAVRRIYPSYEDMPYHPCIPPARSSSGGKAQRPSLTHASSNRYQVRSGGVKYVNSPQGHGGHERDGYLQPVEDHKRPIYNKQQTRTPEYILSPEEAHSRTPRNRRATNIDQVSSDPHRSRSKEWDGEKPESPPPPPLHPSLLHRTQRTPKSVRGEESENESGNEGAYPFVAGHPASVSASVSHSRRVCRYCKKSQQQATESYERVKQMGEQIERLKKELHAAQNTDLAFTNLLRDNERLRQELKKMNRGTDHDVDRGYLEKYEDLKKTKEDLEADLMKKRELIADLRGYKREYNHLRQKYDNLQRDHWQVIEENQRLNVQCMEGERIGSRHQGDQDEPGSKSAAFGNEPAIQRSSLRQSSHAAAVKEGVSKDTSRSRKSSRLDPKRISSAAQVPDGYEDPQKEDYPYTRAKTHRSGGTHTDASSVTDGLPWVTTTPDEQSQVFMIMGEDVSKNVLPECLTKELELALIYSLQNCHTVQEIIKCLVSYGLCHPGDKAQEYRVQNEHLTSRVEHLKSRNTMLANSFENAKANMESMYTHAQKVEANNTRLCYALRLCYQACEIYEVLSELKVPDRQPAPSNPSYFPSFEYNSSLESSTRSPDRERSSSSNGKPPAVLRARNLLHNLDSDAELQNFLPGSRSRHHNGTDFLQTGAVFVGCSQNTGTSGVGSMSGGMEGEITPEELERLRLYTQALLLRKNHFVNTLASVDGVKGLDTVKTCEHIKDCLPSNHSGQIMDLEDAANAEELCKVREEKAELRSQIYMMDQEKRRMELEVSRMLLHKQKSDKLISELDYKLSKEKSKRKRDKKTGRRGDDPIPPHDSSHINQSIELQASLERERELLKRYEDLFSFLNRHVRDSQCVSEDLMGFVKEMRRANSALVDAFEKAKKYQQVERKRMKQELVSYMNKVHQGSSIPTNDDPSSGPVYT